MLPSQLQASSFRSFPPEAQKLAVQKLDLLRRMPLGFVSLLLRELIAYDWKFPAERQDLGHQFAYLESLSPEQFRKTMAPFAGLRLKPELEQTNWVDAPGLFTEQLSAHLWATHQIDQFRAAAVDYVQQATGTPQPPVQQRLGIVVIGQGSATSDSPLFQKLRPHGVYHKQIKPAGAWNAILDCLATRAAVQPYPFAHWYIDGSAPTRRLTGVAVVSYPDLIPVRSRLQSLMEKSFESGVSSETLRTNLATLHPKDFGFDDTVLSRFQLALLTEASGTQIFSTTFVQWAAREAWRRAQPLTLVARFALRQRDKSMKQMLAEARTPPDLDPEGSLVDADMGAYYTWLNQQRLPGAENARFLVWFEDHREAVMIAPGLPRGTESRSPTNMSDLLA